MQLNSSRLRLILRILSALLLVTLALTAAAAWFLQRNSRALIEQYVNEAAARSGLTISFGAANVTLLPLPALAVSDARVEGDGWHFSVAYATLLPDIPSLLHGTFRPHSVTLLRPRVNGALPVPLCPLREALPPDAAASPAQPSRHAPQEGLAHSAALSLLPDSCKLHVTQGEADVTGTDAARLTLDGLRCDLHLKRGTRLRGSLFWDVAVFAPEGSPPTRLDNLALEGKTNLEDPLRRTPRLSLKGTLQRPDWLARLNVALDASSDGPRQRVVMRLAGELRKDGVLIPASLAGTAVRQEDAEGVRLEDLRLGLGRDSGGFNGSLRLGGPNLFELDGRLLLRRASLTQWLGFARNLPPGLQIALDALTEGVLDISMDGKGLRVPHIEVTASGSRFVGSGGVESWAQPVVALDLKAPVVDLGRALPESTGVLPAEPQFGHEAFTPRPGNPVIPGEINVGYDIRLGATTVQYGPLVINDAQVVIKPGLVDAKSRLEDTLLLVQGTLYGGGLKGETILGGSRETPYAIRLQLRNVDGGPLARALPVMPVAGGRLRGDVNIMSQGKELRPFLDKLRGTVNVRAERGILRRPGGKGGKNGAPAFRTLEVGFKARSGQWKQGSLGLDGQWTAAMTDEGLDAEAELSGTLWFGGAGGPVAFQNLPGTVSLNLSAERSFRPSGVQAQASGNFSCQAANGRLTLSEGHITALGAEATGTVRVDAGKEGPTWQGRISLSLPDTAKTLRLAGCAPPALPAGLRRLTLDTAFKGDAGSLTLSELRARADQTDLSGSLALKWQKTPEVQFNLSTRELHLDRYLTHKKNGGGKDGKGKSPATGQAVNGTPWDLRFMRAFNARGELQAGEITLWKLRLRNVRLAARLTNGVLDIESSKAAFYGANLSARARLRFSRGLNADTTLAVESFDLGAASRDRGGDSVLGGRGTIKAELRADLTASGQLPSRLNGTWRFLVTRGFHQPRDKHGELKGKPTRFETAGASGSLENGLARSRDFLLRGEDLKVTGGGWINLVNDTLDCNFNVNKKNFPDFPLRLYGSLEDSKTSIGAGTLLLNTLGGIAGGVVDVIGGLLEGTWKLFR
ncbi:MAG: hypothetical protein J6N67_00685 [Desulfovibrio sp.]|nr:hypothetical protein [Desulfovibrio sp.]